ncbi:hypothetical protein HYW83_05995 [Candidatus Peregrinibacteria bacterium]|nr:hypothetical protein [Candidatus Peregrinibacteria bacterium]
MEHLPIVKMSDLQKKTKQVVEAVKEDGYRFIMNRGNPEVVMVSMVYFKNTFGEKKRRNEEKNLFREWKGKTWRQILRELRKEDNKKPFDQYLKEVIEWQKQFLS